MDLNNLTLKASPAFDIRRERRRWYRYLKHMRECGIPVDRLMIKQRPRSIRRWDKLNTFGY